MDGLEEAGLPASTFTALKKPVGEVIQDVYGPCKKTPPLMPSLTTHIVPNKMKFLRRLGVRQSTSAG